MSNSSSSNRRNPHADPEPTKRTVSNNQTPSCVRADVTASTFSDSRNLPDSQTGSQTGSAPAPLYGHPEDWVHPLPENVRVVLEKTAKIIRKEEIRRAIWSLLGGSVLLLWCVVLAEHWLFTAGLPAAMRKLILLGLVGTWLGIFLRKILPFWLWRIHPFYLAMVIEKARPELKNSLLNLLFLLKKEKNTESWFHFGAKSSRGIASGMARWTESQNPSGNTAPMQTEQILEQRVLKILERQTANRMNEIQPEELGVRPSSKRLIFAILCVLILFGCYGFLAPKSTFRSVARTILPWCGIQAPTRVLIWNIDPEDCTIYQGETLKVRARFLRLRPGETPTLFYSSRDQTLVNVPVQMQLVSGDVWEGEISGTGTGIQRPLTWHLAAGDAVSPTFEIRVRSPLSVQINEVRIVPPAYTRLPVVLQKSGDILAISGSTVHLRVQTSEPSTKVLLELRNTESSKIQRVELTPDIHSGTASETRFHGSVALGSLTETKMENEKWTARFLFQNRNGTENRNPLIYRWEIRPDFGPMVRVLEGPTENDGRVPEDSITMTVEAADPDFGLRGVAICVRWTERLLQIPALLNLPSGHDGMKTPFRGSFDFCPADWGLEAGDEVVWWAEAADNCKPEENRSKTTPRRLRILSSRALQAETQEPKVEDGDSENADPLNSDEKNESGANASPTAQNTDSEEDGTSPFPVSVDFPKVEEAETSNPENPAENPMKDAQSQGENLEDEAGSSDEPKSQNGTEDPNDADSPNGADSQNGSDSQNSAETQNGADSQNGSETQNGADSQNGSETQNGADSQGNSASGMNSGESRESGDAPKERTTQPKVAPTGFDPLDEQEASDEGTKSAEESNEKGTEKNRTPENSSGAGEKSEEGAQEDSGEKENGEGEKDGENDESDENGKNNKNCGNEENGEDGENGGNGKQKNSGKEDGENGGPGAGGLNPEAQPDSSQPSPESPKNGSKPKPGTENLSENSSENPSESPEPQDVKSGKGRKPQPDAAGVEVPLEEESENSEDSEEPEGADDSRTQKKTGRDLGAGAKTDSEAPEDATNAQSGTQSGSDSKQDLPTPVMEKETSDGSGLQDSNSRRPDREIMEGEGEEAEDSAPQETQLAKASDVEGRKPDPVTQPGEAMEEILKHREETRSSGETPQSAESQAETQSELPPNPDSPDGTGSETPPPQKAPSATVGQEPKELQNHEQEASSTPNPESQGPESRPEQESGQSSPQNGSQEGNAGDRKSRNEIKPDNSAESGGRSGENRGGNRQGAEEQSNQQGLGRDGSNTPNESGNPAGSGGEGPTGERGGNSALSDHPTGVPDPEKRQGDGTEIKSGERQSQAYGSGSQSQKSEHSTTSGGSGIGENVRSPIGTQGLVRSSEKEDAVNVEFARRQSVLALEHLRDALDRDDDSLLEYLGWTRDEARQFLEEWEKLNEELNHDSLTPDERREKEDAFRNLGLTQRSFRYENQTESETKRPGARSGRKVEAPGAWREQFDAFSRGVGNGE